MHKKRGWALFAFAVVTAEIATVLAFVQASKTALSGHLNPDNLQWSVQHGSVYGAIGGLLIGTVAAVLPEFRRPYLKVLCSSATLAALTGGGFIIFIAASLRI